MQLCVSAKTGVMRGRHLDGAAYRLPVAGGEVGEANDIVGESQHGRRDAADRDDFLQGMSSRVEAGCQGRRSLASRDKSLSEKLMRQRGVAQRKLGVWRTTLHRRPVWLLFPAVDHAPGTQATGEFPLPCRSTGGSSAPPGPASVERRHRPPARF